MKNKGQFIAVVGFSWFFVVLVAMGEVSRTPSLHGRPTPNVQPKQPIIGAHLSTLFRQSYIAAVKKYVDKNIDKKDKLFHFWDDVVEEEWLLQLVKVEDEKLVSLGHDRYFAPVEFVHKNQPSVAEDTPVILDVYALRVQDEWEIEEIYIRSVNEVPRYTYDKDNNRIFPDGEKPFTEE